MGLGEGEGSASRTRGYHAVMEERSGRGAWRRAGWPGAGGSLPAGLAESLWLFIALRLGYSAFGFMLASTVEVFPPCAGGEAHPPLRGPGPDLRFFGVWQRWDACWYEQIALQGYRAGESGLALFPLYPFLLRIASLSLASNLTLVGFVVSGVAFVAAMTGLYQLVRDDFGETVAQRAVLYVAVFPTAFFLLAPFTESLFLALAVWAILCARRGSWHAAGILALCAGLTRAQGSLLALPLAWELYRQWRSVRPHSLAAVVPLLPPVGLSLVLAYTALTTGATAFDGQRQMGMTTSLPWTALAASWQVVRTFHPPFGPVEALNLAALLLTGVLFYVGLGRIPTVYTLYAAPQLLVLAFRQSATTPLLATGRYVLVIFPIFVVLALLITRRAPRLHAAWLGLSIGLLAYCTTVFVIGWFVA